MAVVRVECPPRPGGRLPSSQIEPSSVWRLAGDTLNITCNFLYCNHQVHRDFLITLYVDCLSCHRLFNVYVTLRLNYFLTF
jgi:hypothetical protein